jgi:hypothetical protein
MEAVMRSTSVAMKFAQTPDGYSYTVYLDGNGNGVLTPTFRAVSIAVSTARTPSRSLCRRGVRSMPGLPPIDPGGTPPGTDPIRLGVSSLATFTALGTSSSGTVYIRGHRDAQYAVRIFGDTGKTRLLKFVHPHRPLEPAMTEPPDRRPDTPSIWTPTSTASSRRACGRGTARS